MDTTNALSKALGACALAAGALCFMGGATPDLQATVTETEAAAEATAPDPRRDALATYVAEKYRVDLEQARRFVDEAYAAGDGFGVDPLLVLAVMAVESSFNPAARSGAGARGLMQVVPRFHREKLAEHGGESALLDPRVNALVGTRILKDYIRQAGDLRAGLQRYAGWQDDDGRRYAGRVIAEKERLRRVVLAAARNDRSAS